MALAVGDARGGDGAGRYGRLEDAWGMADDKRDNPYPKRTDARYLVESRQRLADQLQCPECGSGRMPETIHCANCGVVLPVVERDETPEITARKQPRQRAMNWVIDLVPAVVSPKVLLASLAAVAVAALLGVVSLRTFGQVQGASGSVGSLRVGAIFPAMQGFSIGCMGMVANMLGMGWLLSGELCAPWTAYFEFRAKHWQLAFILTSLGVTLVFIVA